MIAVAVDEPAIIIRMLTLLPMLDDHEQDNPRVVVQSEPNQGRVRRDAGGDARILRIAWNRRFTS